MTAHSGPCAALLDCPWMDGWLVACMHGPAVEARRTARCASVVARLRLYENHRRSLSVVSLHRLWPPTPCDHGRLQLHSTRCAVLVWRPANRPVNRPAGLHTGTDVGRPHVGHTSGNVTKAGPSMQPWPGSCRRGIVCCQLQRCLSVRGPAVLAVAVERAAALAATCLGLLDTLSLNRVLVPGPLPWLVGSAAARRKRYKTETVGEYLAGNCRYASSYRSVVSMSCPWGNVAGQPAIKRACVHTRPVVASSLQR